MMSFNFIPRPDRLKALFLGGLLFLVLAAAPTAFADEPVPLEEVSLNAGDAVLAGTLSLPEGKGPHPAVFLMCGSGDQTREWDIDGDRRYCLGAMLAEALNQAGIAVLRLDDRGTGLSTGQKESVTGFDTLKQDALAALEFLRKHAGISRIGIGGISGGAEIAVMTAAESPLVDFLVLLSGPFVSGAEVLMAQAGTMPEAFAPDPQTTREDWVRKAVDFQKLCIAAAKGEKTDEFKSHIRSDMRIFLGSTRPDDERAKFSDFEAEVEKQTNDAVRGFQSAWFKSFVSYNPADDLEKITCPILAVYGEMDNRVIADHGWKPLLQWIADHPEALSPDITVRIIPGANHFLTDRNHALKGEMMPGVADILTAWINERVKGE